MKKLTGFMFILCCVLALTGCSAVRGSMPYQDISADEIVAAAVQLSPPDKTIQIEDVGPLAALLKDVVIYDEDDSYTEYSGQGVIFTLTMADGRQTSVMAYNPFLVIDGVGYRTKYEPCQALNAYANRLLSAEDAVVILTEPPALSVVSDETAFGALLGGYSWQSRNADGTATGVVADSAHPLDCRELLPVFETTEKTALLRFQQAPDSILAVRCWSDAHWSDPTAESESADISGLEIALKPGGYIYEITAQWDAESGYGGTAHYAVYIRYTDEGA